MKTQGEEKKRAKSFYEKAGARGFSPGVGLLRRYPSASF
jgi:hypothetical protein